MLDGELLEDLGKKGEKMTHGFEIALEDVLQDKTISPKAQELLRLKIPRIMYYSLAAFLNYNARKNAKKNGFGDITRKVYLE